MWNKRRYCWQLQNLVRIQNFRRSNGKTTKLGNTEYFYVVLRYGRSCQEVCGTLLWVGEQNCSITLQGVNSIHWRQPIQRKRRIEISRSIVRCMRSHGPWNVLHLARIGRPDILSSVSKFARAITKCTRACDKRPARLISYIQHTSEYKHNCNVGNSIAMPIGTVSRLWPFGRSWRFEIVFRPNTVRIRKPHVCPICSLHNKKLFLWMQVFTLWRNSSAWSLVFGHWCDAFKFKSKTESQASKSIREANELIVKLAGFSQTSRNVECLFCFLKREFLS